MEKLRPKKMTGHKRPHLVIQLSFYCCLKILQFFKVLIPSVDHCKRQSLPRALVRPFVRLTLLLLYSVSISQQTNMGYKIRQFG